MSKMHEIRIASVAVLFAAWSYSAQAQLDGSTINVSAYYPDTSSVYQNGGNTVVSGSTEYPTGSFPSYNPTWSVDVTDNQMIITGSGFPYGVASFNGWVLTILSGPEITSAAADPSSQFFPVGISIVGGDQLFLNYSGVDGNGVESSIIDINSSSVPDGGLTIALLGTALAGLSLIRRKF